MKKVPEYCMRVEDIFPSIGGKKEGEVGIEIEVEGTNLLKNVPSYWEVHEENSLRGESKEYALTKPVKRKSALPILKYLKKRLDDSKSIIDNSQRTGVHVHINCQGMPLRQVFNFLVLYLVFENLFVEYAGEDRVGNVFCLRAKDAEYFIDHLAEAIQKDDYSAFVDEKTMRYSSVNVCALWKFNSLEFRALRGTVDPDLIYEWITLLLALKDYAVRFKDPREIMAELSVQGPRDFLTSVFGGLAKKLDRRNLEDVIWESARLVQEIAFAVDWQSLDQPSKSRMFAKNRYPEPRIKPPVAQPRPRRQPVFIDDDVRPRAARPPVRFRGNP